MFALLRFARVNYKTLRFAQIKQQHNEYQIARALCARSFVIDDARINKLHSLTPWY